LGFEDVFFSLRCKSEFILKIFWMFAAVMGLAKTSLAFVLSMYLAYSYKSASTNSSCGIKVNR
jgi:hypothetical protein